MSCVWKPTIFQFSGHHFYSIKDQNSTEAYKGHCVLCKDVLSFVFQTFDFQFLCFGFCVFCPVLLNGAMET